MAWRAQLLGWRCLYVPDAVGYHVRSVGPANRRSVPAVLNMHSVKNRFLMRIKNMTGGLYRRFWLPATARDLLVVGGCLLWEQRSLPAFWRIVKCLPRALRHRRWIMARRRVTDESLAQWFSPEPSAERLQVGVEHARPVSADMTYNSNRPRGNAAAYAFSRTAPRKSGPCGAVQYKENA